MASLFDPADPLMPFDRPDAEYQVNVDPVPGVDGMSVDDQPDEKADRSYYPAYIIFVLLLVTLVFKLTNLQITNGQLLQVKAKGNSIETRRLTPPRGEIVDQTGQVIARNVPVYNLDVYPAQLPKKLADREALYDQVQAATGIPKSDIDAAVKKTGLSSLEPVVLKNNIDRDTALLWQTHLGSILGVSVDDVPFRSYDASSGLAHLVGYVGKVTQDDLNSRPDLLPTSQIGKTGLELSYEEQLQGTDGKEDLEVNSKGQIQRVVSADAALPGKTLELYLDKDLQRVMTDALESGMKAAGRTKGVAIALDPQTGGVLGMVSAPYYDNNLFVQNDKQKERQALFDNKDLPLFNRAIAGAYPPGSTSKPVWAVAGLSEGAISESTDIQTPAEITVGQSHFPDWKSHGHADVKKAIAESNNIFFYAVAGGYDKIKGIGPVKMKDYATKFGWGQPTKVDLPGEKKGLVPDPDWKKKNLKESWFIGDSYHEGIGQGYLSITPIQLIRSIATIANGGTLYAPRLVKEIKDSEGNTVEKIEPQVDAKNMIDPNVDRIVREGMRQTVLAGTSRPLNEIAMPIAGKTGTAQFSAADTGKTHAWFVGFAPYDNPTIALLVMIEDGGESFTYAVPVAKQILSWYSDNRYKRP